MIIVAGRKIDGNSWNRSSILSYRITPNFCNHLFASREQSMIRLTLKYHFKNLSSLKNMEKPGLLRKLRNTIK